MQLRPKQLEALQAIKARRDAGVLRQLVVAPVAFGKAVLFANMPSFLGLRSRMLVEVHREELAQQAADKLRKWNPDLRIGVEMAESRASDNDDVIVAGVQTLYASNFRRLDDLLSRFKFEICVVDEAHRFVAEKYKETIKRQIAANPNLLTVGFTATPNRHDGQAMGQLFDEIVYNYPMRTAIEEGWLVEPIGVRISTKTDLSRVATRAGDFAQDELEKQVNTPERNDLIVKGWIEHAQDRKTIAFCVDVQHAKDLAYQFQKNSIPAQAVWGGDPERKEKLAAHRHGDLKVLSSVGILIEGYDDPSVSCVIAARPTKSQTLFVQSIGRGCRLPEGTDNLVNARRAGAFIAKQDCLVLDVVDVTGRHSLVTLPTLFGLPEKLDLKGRSAIAAVKAIEEAQAKHPDLDLSKITDIKQLETISERVDLWQIKWSDEVIQNSQLQWHKSADGSYCLLLPNKESLVIYQDLLGKWSIKGKIKGHPADSDGFEDLPSAFQYAEMNLMLHGKDLITLLRRESKWHKDAATPKQIAYLRKLKIPFRHDITKGEAGMLITRRFQMKNSAKLAVR